MKILKIYDRNIHIYHIDREYDLYVHILIRQPTRFVPRISTFSVRIALPLIRTPCWSGYPNRMKKEDRSEEFYCVDDTYSN